MLSFIQFFESKKQNYNKLEFYYNYFKNLLPKGFKIIKENDKIIIKISN
jgi:hypothetical protein